MKCFSTLTCAFEMKVVLEGLPFNRRSRFRRLGRLSRGVSPGATRSQARWLLLISLTTGPIPKEQDYRQLFVAAGGVSWDSKRPS